MAVIDAFSAQIVDLVRRMPDEAILELVRHQLGAISGPSPLRKLAYVAEGESKRRPAVVSGGDASQPKARANGEGHTARAANAAPAKKKRRRLPPSAGPRRSRGHPRPRSSASNCSMWSSGSSRPAPE